MTWQQAFGLAFFWVMIVRGIELFRIPMPSDWVILEPIRKWAVDGHESDCALFYAPYGRPWPCDCRQRGGYLRSRVAVVLQQRAYDEGLMG